MTTEVYREYVVQTEAGRNISYHAQSPEDAKQSAEWSGNQVKRVLTIEQYERLQNSRYFANRVYDREGVMSK